MYAKIEPIDLETMSTQPAAQIFRTSALKMRGRRAARWGQTAGIAILLLCFEIGLANYLGVFRSELSSETDETAHYVTALMIHDYVVQGFPTTPVEFAKNYYLHYPKVAIGHWPPMFYVLQAIWMFVFGTSRTAVLVLMCLVAAMIATTLFYVVADWKQSFMGGLLAAILFLLIPLVQKYSGTLMADMPVALFSFWSMLLWTRYMQRPNLLTAIGVALLFAATILTKGNGFALAFIPPVAIALCRRWDLLRHASLWIAGALTAALCLPWTLLTRDLVVPTMQYHWGLSFIVHGGWFYLSQLVIAPGVLASLFAVAGIISKIVLPFRKSQVEPLWASAFGMLAGVVVFHSFVPAGLEDRYLLAALPPLLMFMVTGITWVAARLRFGSSQTRVAALAVAVAVVFFSTAFYVQRKYVYGFEQIARDLLADPQFANAVIFCSSNTNGEGILTSEIAMRERRPGHIILRASRLLADSDWNGLSYTLTVKTAEQIQKLLESIPVSVLVLDLTPHAVNRFPHHELMKTVAAGPQWTRIGVYPKQRDSGVERSALIEVYRTTLPVSEGPPNLTIEILQGSPHVRVLNPPSAAKPIASLFP